MCFSSPKQTPPPIPDPAPQPAKYNDENVTKARDDTTRRARVAAGLASTDRTTGALNAGALQTGVKKLMGQ